MFLRQRPYALCGGVSCCSSLCYSRGVMSWEDNRKVVRRGKQEVIARSYLKEPSQIAPRTSQEVRNIQVSRIEVVELHTSPREGLTASSTALFISRRVLRQRPPSNDPRISRSMQRAASQGMTSNCRLSPFETSSWTWRRLDILLQPRKYPCLG
jgi:hypothetical protein